MNGISQQVLDSFERLPEVEKQQVAIEILRRILSVEVPPLSKEQALVTFVSHTTRARGTRFEVDIETKFLCLRVFDAQNLVTIPYVKLIKKLGMLSPEQLAQVEEALYL